jgi:hypothetical protein
VAQYPGLIAPTTKPAVRILRLLMQFWRMNMEPQKPLATFHTQAVHSLRLAMQCPRLFMQSQALATHFRASAAQFGRLAAQILMPGAPAPCQHRRSSEAGGPPRRKAMRMPLMLAVARREARWQLLQHLEGPQTLAKGKERAQE